MRTYHEAARRAARRGLAEDLAGYGDITGSAFAGDGVARVVAREEGVLSGLAALAATAQLVDPALQAEPLVADGSSFAARAAVAELRGPLSAILACERTGLNFLCRLSGIATLTARYVAHTSGTAAVIAATRKTTPGLRALEKQAVVHGGGTPHRFGLFDGALIKDNHVLAAGGVAAAVALVRGGAAHLHGLEVEVDTLAELDEALGAGAGMVLLDDMDTPTVREAVRRVAGRALVEVSGGVTLERVRTLAEAGVDVISVGALTTAAPWIELQPRAGDVTVLLVVDVGNTQTHVGLSDAGEIVGEWRIATVRHRTSDEIAGLLQGFFSLREERVRQVVDEVGIASVVPRLTQQWVEMCENHLGVTAFVVGPGARTGMRIAMKNPSEVGADRVVNAVAAFATYGGPCIVADYGTATTFDVVSAEGDYLGGAIAPGIEVSLEALTTRAARLIKVELVEPEHAIGKSTTEALQSGAVYGFAGEVEGIVHAIWKELGVRARVIATGGLAEMIARHTDVIDAVDPLLTLRGIEIVLRRQQRS